MSQLVWATRTCFTLLGGREVVTVSRMQELIREANITDFDAITSINLSNKGITDQAAEYLAKEVLDKCNNITVVDIHDIIAGRPEEEALQTLAWICNSLGRTRKLADQITEVNVSDNALGEKGVNACKAILTGRNLQRLYFCNDGMSAEAAALISDLLLASQATTPNDSNNAAAGALTVTAASVPPLTTLHFFNNMSGNGGGHAIARIVRACSATLTDLRFSATRCMKAGCTSIVEALQCLGENQLVRLDLQDNNFGSAGSTAASSNEMMLAAAINRQRASLQHLNLRDANLGNAAICALLRGGLSAITTLDISGNELSAKCAARLSVLLRDCRASLSTLVLDENDELIGSPDDDEDDDEDDEEVGDDGCPPCKGYLNRAKALSSVWAVADAAEANTCALTTVSLASCGLTSGSAVIVYSTLAQMVRMRRLNSANTASAVQLNLNGNHLSEACMEAALRGIGATAAGGDASEDDEDRLVVLGSMEDNDQADEDEDDLADGMLVAQAMVPVSPATASTADDLAAALSKATI